MTDEGDDDASDESAPRLDAGHQHSVETAKKRSRRLAAERDATLAGILEVPQGRRLLWWLLEQSHIFVPSMAATAELTAFREGERNVGLILLDRVMAVAPDAFAAMQAEARAPKPTT